MSQDLSIHDVAREAGVSIATVSRVMNGRSRVAPETKKRVEQAMGRLRYSPDLRARALSLGRTDTIGLILPDLFGDYFGELMRGVDEGAREAGTHLLVSRAADREDEKKLFAQMLQGRRVDGLILMISQRSDSLLDTLAQVNAPLVILDQDVRHHHIDNILVDNRTGARDATQHLIAVHGARDLVFLGGPKDNIDAQDRASGFRDALTAAHIRGGRDLVHFSDYSYESGYALTRNIARMKRKTQWGLVAANDDLARGAIDALTESGLRVPEDVRVVGYDDTRIARLTRPALTTVKVPLREMGREAVSMILDRRDGRRTLPRKSIVKGTLIIRTSCGCGA